MQIYLVGGAVRDKLLGVTPRDRDWVVVGATPEALRQRGYKAVGRDFPVFLHPETGEEYALARTERKQGHGYHGFQFHTSTEVTLEEDLKRRDLTINAMAMDESGQLIDPFGGEVDLQQGRLRHVSAAFREDPVRLLRTARYAARYHKWGFRVAHQTHQLMRQMVDQGEVAHLVAERVWQESARALLEESPQRYIEVLHSCGALQIIFPELAQLFGVPQSAHAHPEIDSGTHVMLVLQQAAKLSGELQVRFAALVHDLGKGVTPSSQLPSHKGHEERGITLVKQLCRRLKVPREIEAMALLVAAYHGLYHRADELDAATLYSLLERLDLFRRPERLTPFLLACEADSRGRLGFENEHYTQPETIRRAYAKCAAIRAQELIAAGFQGQAISDELRRRRIEALSSLT
ncbi:multifunctional CCA addition/repair protein [Ectothiorhodospiraceae bacterium BW-2]|nr:multifunctional CCA addition/repair protein [Ectothiorhodospiraceae bacterium BW-2]